MRKRDDRTRLLHMLEHSKEAVELAGDMSKEDLYDKRTLELSLTKLVEIVCEAAARVSPEFQELHAEIPWQEIIGLRNRLVHGYDAVDLDILWDVVKLDLPELVNALERALGSSKP